MNSVPCNIKKSIGKLGKNFSPKEIWLEITLLAKIIFEKILRDVESEGQNLH